jgi:hypothetical protein
LQGEIGYGAHIGLVLGNGLTQETQEVRVTLRRNHITGRSIAHSEYQAYLARFDLLPSPVKQALWEGVRTYDTDRVWQILAARGYNPRKPMSPNSETAVRATVRIIHGWHAKESVRDPKNPDMQSLCAQAEVAMMCSYPVPEWV